MTREQLQEEVRQALRTEFVNRPAQREMSDRHRLMMADLYSDMGAPMFVYDLLDTPGVLEVVCQYITEKAG